MNVFRIFGDLIHLFAIIWLPLKIWKTRSCSVVSGKSQFLYLLVFICRYLDLFTNFVSYYNTFMKVFFIATTAGTAFIIYKQQLHDFITMTRTNISIIYQNIKVLFAWAINKLYSNSKVPNPGLAQLESQIQNQEIHVWTWAVTKISLVTYNSGLNLKGTWNLDFWCLGLSIPNSQSCPYQLQV